MSWQNWMSSPRFLTVLYFTTVEVGVKVVGVKVIPVDGAEVDSCTKWDIATSKRQKHLDFLWFISLSLSLALLLYQPVTLYHSAVTSFHPLLSLYVYSPYKAQSDFQGDVCWPSVINKDLELQLQPWLVAEASGHRGNGVRTKLGQISKCILTLTQ